MSTETDSIKEALEKTKEEERKTGGDRDGLLANPVRDQYVAMPEKGLEQIYNYFFKELYGDPIPFGSTEKVHLVIEIVGASSGVYSYPPAWEYAKDKDIWLKYCFAITNPMSNVLFLMKATDDMLTAITIEVNVPTPLSGILQPTPRKDLCIKYTKLLLGSVVCSVPFAVTTYLFPLPHCEDKACLGFTVGHSLISNMILHAISWSFILKPDLWYYRIPFLIFEKVIDCIKSCCTSEEDQQLLQSEKIKKDIFEKYQDLLSHFFIESIEYIAESCIEAPELIQTTIEAIEGKNASLTSMIALRKKHPRKQPSNHSNSNRCHLFLLNNAVPTVGAFFMIFGCAGWIVSPIYLGSKEGLDSKSSISIGSLPSYSTAVLCAFYGAGVCKQIYQFLTSWSNRLKNKFTLEARCHPITFATLFGLNLFLSWFSYATGQQLIKTTFSDSEWVNFRSFLLQIEQPALQLLSFVPLLELTNTAMRRFMAKFGDDTLEKRVSRLLIKSSLIRFRLQQMPGDKLMNELATLPPEDLTTIGIDPTQFRQDNITARGVQPLSSIQNTKPIIFSRPKANDEKPNHDRARSEIYEGRGVRPRNSWCEKCTIL